MANLFIRCDDETWQMAHALARKESRSLNKQIVHMIKQQAEREGITVEPIPDKQTIIANYPYAKVLDEGLYPNPPKTVPFNKRRSRNGYSKQAPKGMAEPTEKYIAKLMRKILKGQTI